MVEEASMTGDQNKDRFFAGIDAQLEGMTDAMHKTLWRSGPLSFPKLPLTDKWAFEANPAREFKQWHEIFMQKNGQPCFYQGETINNARDGRGIVVCQGAFMMVGHFKDGLRHGASNVFDSHGDEEAHSYFEGKFSW